MNQIISLHPLLFHSIIILASLIIVAKSADMVVYSISEYAKKLGISDYLIGFLVVSIGTAIPELIAAITGAAINQGPIVFGTVLGSNLSKLPLLGLVLIIARNLKGKNDIGETAPILTFVITMLPLLLIIDGILSRADGIILIIAFIIYIARLWKGEGKLGKMKKDVKLKHILKDGITFLLALGALLLSARWMVFSSLHISDLLNIPPYMIGLIVIGVGASTPEIMVQIRSIINGHHNIAFGNVLGSFVANSAFVLGIVAIIKPVKIISSTLITTAIFLTIGVIYTLVIMEKPKVSWKHGLILILMYILFLLVEWVVG
ncbi:MAG: hypothetical protein KKC75_01565 [Nanoarchaeota archaeon]|nr:hypothetical protein [Nanoarchaeota archaeon]MBU1004762.1 hypothetical protein [Nanoarchaeota archaeon]